MTINAGKVGIGTSSPDQKLTVNGTIHSKEVKVDMNVLPDYVFDPDYKLASLESIKAFVTKNHHLPGVPSAPKVTKNGMNLGEMNAILLKKVEELMLHLIAQKEEAQKSRDKQQKNIELLQKQINQLRKQIK